MRKLLSVPRVPDWMSLVFGSLLFLTPWVLQFTDVRMAAWNAWLCGAAIAVVALLALVAFKPWEEWHGLAIGVWLIVAPFALAFSAVVAATAAHIGFGMMILASEAWEIWQLRHNCEEMA